MAQIVLIGRGDTTAVQFDWDDALPEGVTLQGNVVHTLPTPLVKVDESSDPVRATSTVMMSGAEHGGLYMIAGTATLSNGETLNRSFPVRCFNG